MPPALFFKKNFNVPFGKVCFRQIVETPMGTYFDFTL